MCLLSATYPLLSPSHLIIPLFLIPFPHSCLVWFGVPHILTRAICMTMN